MNISFRWTLALSVLLASVGTARADLVFNAFGPNDTFHTNSAFSISWFVSPLGPSANSSYGVAARFTLGSQAFSLNSVSMAMSSLSGLSGETNLAISIVADSGGKPGGTLLENLATHPTNI